MDVKIEKINLNWRGIPMHLYAVNMIEIPNQINVVGLFSRHFVPPLLHIENIDVSPIYRLSNS